MESEIEVFVPNTDFCIKGPKANVKQIEYLEAVYSFGYMVYAYGGAIRGGKSYVVLFTLHTLCMTYPGSRWGVVRASLPVLIDTTIPSFNKLIDTEKYGTWNLSTHTFTYFNGSQILFKPESLASQPYLNNFLGFECNGIFLEQLEELSKEMYQMAIQRVGTWKLKKQPQGKPPLTKGLIFTTFNPTQKWPKDVFYTPYRNNELPANIFYQPALPTDNLQLPPELFEQWSNLDERYQQQYIKGDWTDFDDKNKLWAYAFDRARHVGHPIGDPEYELYLSFDFNRDPICCSVIQHIDDEIRVIELIKLSTSNIYNLCDYIKAEYSEYSYRVTGDATGKASSAMVNDNLNYYTIIASQLGISNRQIDVQSVNPKLAQNRVLVNSLLSKYKIKIHETKAEALIYDMSNVKMLADGTIKKTNREDPTQQADALDTFRYYCDTHHKSFLKYALAEANESED